MSNIARRGFLTLLAAIPFIPLILRSEPKRPYHYREQLIVYNGWVLKYSDIESSQS